jgi:FixJ family two-component response regulator
MSLPTRQRPRGDTCAADGLVEPAKTRGTSPTTRHPRKGGRSAQAVTRASRNECKGGVAVARVAGVRNSTTVETLDDLTAQEAQVARPACDGRINPEIAAQLFIGPHNVEVSPAQDVHETRDQLAQTVPGALPAPSTRP